MPVQNWFVLTSSQATTIEAMDAPPNFSVWARPVDNASPGIGINLNAAASGVLAGAVVPLVGMRVIAKRVVDDPNMMTYAPSLGPALLALPFCALESETIFTPPEPE